MENSIGSVSNEILANIQHNLTTSGYAPRGPWGGEREGGSKL